MTVLPPGRFLSYFGHVLPGVKQAVQVATPALGADWSQVVPGGEMWRVLTASFTLATAAAVASRYVGMTMTVNGVQTWAYRIGTPATASVTIVVGAQAQVTNPQNVLASGGMSVGLPLVWLPESAVIGTSTGALQANDQYSAIGLLVERLYLTDDAFTLADLQPLSRS